MPEELDRNRGMILCVEEIVIQERSLVRVGFYFMSNVLINK